MSKKISIIIPAYNRVHYLIEAINSCLHQTYKNIEIIIVDDGSTDGTEEKVDELLSKEWKSKPIIYYKQKNAGASAARNLGIEKAQGEFIQFLDSDDLLYATKLQRQLDEISKHNADICSCYGYMGENFGAAHNEVLGTSFESKIDLMHKMCSGMVHAMCTPAPLWRKSVLDASKGWNTSIAFGDDLEYHIRLLCTVSKVCFVPEKLFFVREHADFRLSDAKGNITQILSGIKTQGLIYETLNENKIWDKIFQKGVLKNLKSLYANALFMAENKTIKEIECTILTIAKNPDKDYEVTGTIYLKKLLGKKNLMSIHQILKYKNK